MYSSLGSWSLILLYTDRYIVIMATFLCHLSTLSSRILHKTPILAFYIKLVMELHHPKDNTAGSGLRLRIPRFGGRMA